MQFGTGGKLYTWNGAFPAHIMVLDLVSGERQVVTTLAPADPAGVLYGEVLATPDGKTVRLPVSPRGDELIFGGRPEVTLN